MNEAIKVNGNANGCVKINRGYHYTAAQPVQYVFWVNVALGTGAWTAKFLSPSCLLKHCFFLSEIPGIPIK